MSASVTLSGVALCEIVKPPLRGIRAYSTFRTYVAGLAPKLLSSLVLADPVIFPPPAEPGMRWADGWGTMGTLVALCEGAVVRRNGWKSKLVFYSLLGQFSSVPGRKLCNRSRVIPSLPPGIRSPWNFTLNASFGISRILEKPG